MPSPALKCRACGSPIFASEFSYVLGTQGPPDNWICSPCISRDGLSRYPQAILVLPGDLSDFQKSLLCSCPNCQRDGPAEIAEREATALARRMLAEMPGVNANGDTLGPKPGPLSWSNWRSRESGLTSGATPEPRSSPKILTPSSAEQTPNPKPARAARYP